MIYKRDRHNIPAGYVSDIWHDLSPSLKKGQLKFVSVCLILFLAVGVSAQDPERPSEPKSPSILYKLDLSGQLLPLESQVIRAKRKYHAWGFSGVTMVYSVDGQKSRVRFKAEGKPEFVVRLEGMVDPLEMVQFYHFDEVDGSRVVPIADFDLLNRMSNYQVVPASVDFNAVKYGTSSFKLIPVPTLVPGEYCLVVKLATKWQDKSPGFCFGIDAATN